MAGPRDHDDRRLRGPPTCSWFYVFFEAMLVQMYRFIDRAAYGWVGRRHVTRGSSSCSTSLFRRAAHAWSPVHPRCNVLLPTHKRRDRASRVPFLFSELIHVSLRARAVQKWGCVPSGSIHRPFAIQGGRCGRSTTWLPRAAARPAPPRGRPCCWSRRAGQLVGTSFGMLGGTAFELFPKRRESTSPPAGHPRLSVIGILYGAIVAHRPAVHEAC